MVEAVFLAKSLKNGITEPLEFKTFPYRTTEKIVSVWADKEFDETNNLSATNFVAPYKLIGLAALSVDKAITFFTLFSIQQSIKF